MAVLTKQEAEIPLNGGMDTKQGAELQSMTSLREVTDLRWNKAGELEKRPAVAATATLDVNGLGSCYTSASMSGVYSRRDEVFALTQDFGVAGLTPDGEDLTFMRRPVDSAASVDAALKYAPVACNVSRRFVARANGKNEILIDAVATAVDNGVQVIGWVTKEAGLSGATLHVRAIDLATGVVVMPEQTAAIANSLFTTLSAIPIAEVGYEGVLITVASDGGLFGAPPFTIAAYRYARSTNDFGAYATFTANALSPKHELAANGQTFYFAYTDNTTGFLTVRSGTIAGGLTTTVHTANHAARGGVSIVIGPTRTLIVSVNGASVVYGSTLYAEVLGWPLDVIPLRAITGTAGTDRFSSVSATLETRFATDVAVIFASGQQETGAQADCRFVSAHFVNFTNTAPLAIRDAYIPHAACVGAGTVDGRAHGVFALLGDTNNANVSSNTSLVVARAAFAVGGLTSPIRFDPVARVCHERFGMWTYDYGDTDKVSVVGTSMHFAMQADVSTVGYPQTLFTAQVDFEAKPMSRVDMGDGTTVFGHGQLHSYDGDMPSEAQPVSRPTLSLVDLGIGSGSLTGVLSGIAVLSWVDAAGNLHRSEPSEAVSLTLNTAQVDAYVSVPPFTAYDGVTGPEATVELYLTAIGGSTYHRANNVLALRSYDSISAKDLWYKFEDITEGDASFPRIYTTQSGGQERASKAPPAFRAVTRVGDLLWAIDAEDPSRIWHTKPLVAGYAPEWNTLNTLFLGDSGVGISDVNGVPTVFAEHGIWQIYGEGPNALGVGSFAPARRLPHEIECLDGLSVCKTGAGVFFRGRRGVYLLDTGLALQPVGLSIDPSLSVSGTVSGYCRIVHDELGNEVHVLDFDGTHYVFNLLEGKWATWTGDALDQDWLDAVVVHGRVYTLHNGASSTDAIKRIYAADETGYNLDTATWSIETPWVRFDGTTGQMRIWEVVVQIRVGTSDNGACGGSLSVVYETRDGETDRFSFSAAEIEALKNDSTGDPGATVNLRCRITHQRTRQFRLTISAGIPDYAYEGHVPIAVRVLYGITPSAGRKLSTGQSKGSFVPS